LRDKIEYAEVQFYFLHFATHDPDETPVPYAVVSLYSHPVQSILDESCDTLWACRYTGTGGLRVIKLSCILACVSIQPLPPLTTDPEASASGQKTFKHLYKLVQAVKGQDWTIQQAMSKNQQDLSLFCSTSCGLSSKLKENKMTRQETYNLQDIKLRKFTRW
jgi:hypothetical protein